MLQGKLRIKNESGFTILHGLVAVVVIFIVGFAGWYVSRPQADSKKSSQESSTSGQSNQPGDDKNGVPRDWKWYESKELGFKFAYPGAYGNVTENTEYCCGLTKGDYPNVDVQYKTETPKNSGITGVSGDFFIETYNRGVDEILSRTYGPTIRMMPNDGRWAVTKPNNADPQQYRVGMIYKEVVSTKNGNLTIDTFKTGDEGILAYQLVFYANDRLHILSLPNFDTGQGLGDGPATPNDQKPYDELRDQVIKSISLVK